MIDPAGGKILWSAEGELLAQLYHPASNPLPTAEELKNGTSKLPRPRISIWFTVGQDSVPDFLTHRVTFCGSGTGKDTAEITGGTVRVRKDLEPVIIGSPVRGPGWIAIETSEPLTHHFLGQITVESVTRVPQKYAQDWIYVDPNTGAAVTGNASLAKNYLGYGKEIYSVSNGTVVNVMDGLPDYEEIYAQRKITFENAAGNYVIIDMGNDKYACYAHLIPGSITVAKGETVTEGQMIGLMGNSGNSDLPHLHFQVVTDKASFLGAEGYPHVYRSFEVIGMIDTLFAGKRMEEPGYTITQFWGGLDEFFVSGQPPSVRQNVLPTGWEILRMP
ncbi:hypothetical protein SDC9_28589 [bioreactor metagenome]|uniref:M23ase beta-sheet core domain-containing protein n=1 Tax=bioreactor metagenome TaxID=1076179 RepID=A0A644UVF7_9ZZZZ|nr:M23 family metallopeptidase [Methanocorpusculum sp.]